MGYEEACVVCEKQIYRSTNKRVGREIRSIRAITCSKKCSKIYMRVMNRERSRLYLKIKKLQNEIKRLKNDKQKR